MMEKKALGSSKNCLQWSHYSVLLLSVSEELFTFLSYAIFCIHEKCLRISINGHFSYVLIGGDAVSLTLWHRKFCLILCCIP